MEHFLKDTSFEKAWQGLSQEQKNLFEEAINGDMVSNFLERERENYRIFVDKIVSFKFGGIKGDSLAWQEARPDMLKKYIREAGYTPSYEYCPLLDQSGEVFLPEGKDVVSDFFTVASLQQKNLLIRMAEGVISEIVKKDTILLENFLNIHGTEKLDGLPDVAYGRKDLFLRILEICGGKITDVISRHENVGRNAGGVAKSISYPFFSCPNLEMLNYFRERFGFEYPLLSSSAS